MLSFLNFLNCYQFFHLVILDDAREVHFEHDSSMRITNFVEHKSRYLQVSKHSETKAQEFTDCAMECLMTPSCISLNMASSKDQRGTFWCELLLDDMFNNTQNFKENATSGHFSKWVSEYITSRSSSLIWPWLSNRLPYIYVSILASFITESYICIKGWHNWIGIKPVTF